MGLTKEDVLDLIQPPEDANKFVKGLTSLTKKTLKYFVNFKDGGYKPKYPQKFQDGGTLQFLSASPLEKLKTASGYAAETVSAPFRKKIADNLYPFSYQGGVSRIINAVRGKREERDERTFTKEDPEYLQERTDLLQLHMGQDQKYNSVPESKYKPSIAKDDDVTYYTSPETEELIKKDLKWRTVSEIDKKYFGDEKMIPRGRGGVLGQYTLSKGEDEKGKYVSYYDKWDFNPFDYLPSGKTQKSLKKAYEKTLGFFGMDAPEVYGRVYYNDKDKTDDPYDNTIKQKGGYRSKQYPQKFQEGGNDKVTPLDMDYVTYGTKEYNKAYKQGKVATTSYDDQGDVTFHAQMLPEVEIEAERGSGPSTLESAAYSQEVNPVIRGVQQSGREKVALATLGLPTAGIVGAELGLGYAGQQLVRSGSQSAYTNILKPTAQKLIAPMKRYGTKAATDFTNLMSKSPAGQTLMQTAKSKTGSLLSGTYNTMKGIAVPQVYQTLGKQVITESKGEGNIDNRLQAIKKTTDIAPQLAIVKDSFKIGKDLYDKDYDSAALRTLALAGDKNPLLKYGTKLLNKATDTNILESAPETTKKGMSTLKEALTPFMEKDKQFVRKDGLIAGNRYGGYRKKFRKKKRK